MDLSSCTLVTKEYIAQSKEADAIQSPARLIRTGVDALQPGTTSTGTPWKGPHRGDGRGVMTGGP